MLLPKNLIVNADDFGVRHSVNEAVLHCYLRGYINSTSLMTNQPYFEEAVAMIHANKVIKNVGVHVNLTGGKPITDFNNSTYLLEDGHWNSQKTVKRINFLDTSLKRLFFDEIDAQVQQAIKAKVNVTHLDAHRHLHAVPGFFPLFLKVAEQNKLKLRLAQTYNQGNYLKFLFRKYLNRKIMKAGCNYSSCFETMEYYIQHQSDSKYTSTVEVMLHPDFDSSGELTDHYVKSDMEKWLSYLKKFQMEAHR